MEKQLRLLDLALGEKAYSDWQLDFPMVALPFSNDKESNTVLISEIPVRRIQETIGDETELISLVLDQNRTVVNSEREEIDWEANDRPKIYHYSLVSLSPGSYDCRVIIRNLKTGVSALASGKACVPEKKEKGLQLYPPILLRPGKGALYLRASHREKAPAGPASPSLRDVFSIEPNEYTPNVEKALPRASEVLASVRCAFTGVEAGGIQLTAFFVDLLTEERVAVPLRIMNEKDMDGLKTYLVRFRVPELESDEYSLVFVAEEPASGEMSVVGCDFVIQ